MIVCFGVVAAGARPSSAGFPGDVPDEGAVAAAVAGAVAAGLVAGCVAGASSARTSCSPNGPALAVELALTPAGSARPASAVPPTVVTTWNVKCSSLLLYSKYLIVRNPNAQSTVSPRKR